MIAVATSGTPVTGVTEVITGACPNNSWVFSNSNNAGKMQPDLRTFLKLKVEIDSIQRIYIGNGM